ncbi:hypothetical protein GOBAR_DD24210 [Gossypium barbadense]|nr:hypothetical protein GOBAR_DD24210 [Gossypium barbadense]
MVKEITLLLIQKDLILGKGSLERNGVSGVEFSLLKRDVNKSVVNGIPSIEFSKRIHQFLIKEMSTLVVLNLLGRNIGFVALQNRLYGIWRSSKPFQLMDIENGYFLAKFQSPDDYEKILSQGSRLIFGKYLTVQPWSIDFNPTLPYPQYGSDLD